MEKIDLDLHHHEHLTPATSMELDRALNQFFWPINQLTDEQEKLKKLKEAEESAKQKKKKNQRRRNLAKKKKKEKEALEVDQLGYLKLVRETFDGASLYKSGFERKEWRLPCVKFAKTLLLSDSMYRCYKMSKQQRKGTFSKIISFEQ